MSRIVSFLICLITCSEGYASGNDLFEWVKTSTLLKEANYLLVKKSSDKRCVKSGKVRMMQAGDKHVAVYFGQGLMIQAAGKQPYASKGPNELGCTLSITTNELKNGLLLVTKRKCGEGSEGVERQRLLSLKDGFRIENESQSTKGKWVKGTNCTYRLQAKK